MITKYFTDKEPKESIKVTNESRIIFDYFFAKGAVKQTHYFQILIVFKRYVKTKDDNTELKEIDNFRIDLEDWINTDDSKISVKVDISKINEPIPLKTDFIELIVLKEIPKEEVENISPEFNSTITFKTL